MTEEFANRCRDLSPRIVAAVLAAGLLTAGGCGTDSYFDPSVIGRWEETPTVVPILEHIAVIEPDAGPFVEYSDVTPEDLIPITTEYRTAPGDALEITVYDIPQQNLASTYPRIIDELGYIELPQLGRLYVSGMSAEQVQETIADAMRDLVAEPLVSVVVAQRGQQTYTIAGAVGANGAFAIPRPDYRLLEALAAAGWLLESTDDLYVIRQVPLAQDVEGMPQPPTEDESEGPDLLEMIDELSGEDGGSPGVMQPQEGGQPEIDLIEDTPQTQQEEPPGAADTGSTWMFLNGKWVLVKRAPASPPAGAPEGGDPLAAGRRAEELVTQRVIRVPIEPLIAGDARYNVVVRPGDVIRVPAPRSGYIYMGGQVARPGVFAFGEKLTLLRAIDAAGGLGPIGIPERVELMRMIGRNHQATIMLNLRAIAEQTEPDIFLKKNDRINVGTNWWAYPLAVFRNGLRFNYGFGLLIDRNFGNDVFGAPPTNWNDR